MIRLSVAASVAFSLMAGASAHAQNNKPIRTGNFYEDRAANSISQTRVTLTFAQIPTDKFLNITRIMCLAQMNATQTLSFARVAIGTTSGSSDTERTFYLDFPADGVTAGGLRVYSLNPQTFIKVGPGRFPSMTFTTSGTGSSFFVSADCTIIGDLSDN